MVTIIRCQSVVLFQSFSTEDVLEMEQFVSGTRQQAFMSSSKISYWSFALRRDENESLPSPVGLDFHTANIVNILMKMYQIE